MIIPVFFILIELFMDASVIEHLFVSQAWWIILVIQAFRRLKQEN
jgi:hypothetical protein